MKNKRRFIIFLVLIFQAVMMFACRDANISIEMLIGSVVLCFLGDVLLSFWQLHVCTGKFRKIGDFGKSYLIYCAEKIVILGLDFLLGLAAKPFYSTVGKYILGEENADLMFVLLCAVTMVLSAVVTLIVGTVRAAKTKKS